MHLAAFYWLFAALYLLAGCAAALNAELQSAKNAQKPIFVGDIAVGGPDRKGHISALAQFFNTSPNTYKYVDFHVEAYNRVGDRVHREGDETPVVQLRFTGPLAPRRTPGITTWPKVWHLNTVTCLVVKRIDITHMDGTSLVLEGPALAAVLAEKPASGCRIK